MRRMLLATALWVLALPALGADEDEACLKCHADAAALKKSLKDPTKPFGHLLLDGERYARSVHAARGCAECHFDYDSQPHAKDAETAACSECHEEPAEIVAKSVHGPAERGATCADCHGVHDILKATERDARLYPLNVYKACGKCHLSVDPETATVEELLHDPYTDDAHAHGILRDGLEPSATCVSCHGGHAIRPQGDPDSRVARHNVDKVCGECHVGIVEQYRQSVHHLKSNGKAHRGATCSDCHRPHEITTPDNDFRAQTIQACSKCHDERGGSFRLSYHGRRTILGFQGDVASCDACHGMHKVLPSSHPESLVHPANKVATCAKCHEDAHEEFANYLVHVDVTDPEGHTGLYIVYRVMTGLLVVVLILGILHAFLWLVRSLAAGEWRRPPVPKEMRYVRRWPRVYVFYHIMLMTCVLLLACTGMPLHYADQPWATNLMNTFGGAHAAGWVHRTVAVVMVALFFVYILHVAWRFLFKREKGLFTGGNTMLPRFKDLQDIIGNFRWFLFLGPRPKYDRWTYWEKFDFWAVFWGMFVIGLSGLILWFPEEATRYVPGWFINAAVIIHGIEALLDIAFIFTVHVFHANLRPDKFPMDTMYFSGRMTEEEFRHERPLEYERALREGTLESMLARTPARRTRILAYVIGSCALAVGFFFVIAMLFALRSGV